MSTKETNTEGVISAGMLDVELDTRIEDMDTDRDPWIIIGRALGYPDCCIRAFCRLEHMTDEIAVLEARPLFGTGFVCCAKCADKGSAVLAREINAARERGIGAFPLKRVPDCKDIVKRGLAAIDAREAQLAEGTVMCTSEQKFRLAHERMHACYGSKLLVNTCSDDEMNSAVMGKCVEDCTDEDCIVCEDIDAMNSGDPKRFTPTDTGDVPGFLNMRCDERCEETIAFIGQDHPDFEDHFDKATDDWLEDWLEIDHGPGLGKTDTVNQVRNAVRWESFWDGFCWAGCISVITFACVTSAFEIDAPIVPSIVAIFTTALCAGLANIRS